MSENTKGDNIGDQPILESKGREREKKREIATRATSYIYTRCVCFGGHSKGHRRIRGIPLVNSVQRAMRGKDHPKIRPGYRHGVCNASMAFLWWKTMSIGQLNPEGGTPYVDGAVCDKSQGKERIYEYMRCNILVVLVIT